MLSTSSDQKSSLGKQGIKVPHVWTIILFCLILAGIMTYIVPAGVYDRVEVAGRQVIDPNTFHRIPQTPVTPFSWFAAFYPGCFYFIRYGLSPTGS